ncbi:PREDICTED: MATH domain-containing protein At5g43560-like [Tarenaya hassleriana]|uniref:MATH domain-containing protein At5g43560-like n=1 Tax=Tarenaya hassleriana TaxID=28532 RepID=UPI00053C736F|nr:PREDICTED: MATH domain-containing protein At5g43560-like [Tarenaya hassleriana]
MATTADDDTQFWRQNQSMVTDEFPHLDIINDLLEDENGSNGGNGFHVPQLFNLCRQFAHYQGTGLSGGDELLSCRSRKSYSDEGFGHGDWEYMHHHASASANMDLSLLSMMNPDESGCPSLSSSINGCSEFRPSNGH